MRTRALMLGMLMLVLTATPAAADQPANGEASSQAKTGGAEYGVEAQTLPRPIVAGDRAVLLEDGIAAAPANAPAQVQEAVWAANELQKKPYVYGGGHADFVARGYDCSGTVSFALHAADLLKRPRDSSGFMRYGAAGKGKWITIYTNPGHAYVVIAGLRLDTSSAGDRVNRGRGPRWRASGRPTRGFRVRHPIGF